MNRKPRILIVAAVVGGLAVAAVALFWRFGDRLVDINFEGFTFDSGPAN